MTEGLKDQLVHDVKFRTIGAPKASTSRAGGYLKNDSNDSFYQFDNYFGSVGLEFKLEIT